MKSAALAEPSDMSDDEEVPVPRLVPSRPAVPKSLDMVINAIVAINDKKGASIQAIKTYILAHYPTIDPSRLGSRLKNAIPKGLDEGLLVRPKNSETAGMRYGSCVLCGKYSCCASVNCVSRISPGLGLYIVIYVSVFLLTHSTAFPAQTFIEFGKWTRNF